jgi:hypothetical protein
MPGDPIQIGESGKGLSLLSDQSTESGSMAIKDNNNRGYSTSTSIGSGSSNTDKIIAQNYTGTDICGSLARANCGGGYSDWYLPSIYELSRYG